jgi:phosphate transport system substrate-binding protein
MKKLFTSLTILPLMATAVMAADTINGAGATFPAPIYQKWFDEFKAAHPNVQVNYQPIGSGGGVTQLQKGTVDFGASDMPMTDDQIKATPVKPLHFPTVMGAVVLSYNIPGVAGKLKFSPEAIAGMYLGTIEKWNDPKIKADNPGVNLPNKEIEIVHRSDGSGTTYAFTDYLAKVSPEWKSKVGVNGSAGWIRW